MFELNKDLEVHYDIKEDVYHATDYCSASQLEALYKDVPAIARYKFLNNKPTAAMQKGTAAHFLILEPERFEIEVINSGVKDRRSKIYKDLVTENPGRVVLPQGEYESVLAMRDEIFKHPYSELLINGAHAREMSAFWNIESWDDYERGTLVGLNIKAKARFDGVTFLGDDGIVWDLKTTADASRDAFLKTSFNLGYHRKAAFYMDFARRWKPELNWSFVVVAVRSQAPFLPAFYQYPESWIDKGAQELLEPLTQYKKCSESDVWPGYNQELTTLEPKHWMFND